MNDRTIFWQWVRATWSGWVLGVPCVIVLALLGEAVGIGGAQVLVGAGMGAGIGLMQGRAMRGVLQKFLPWFWACVVGLAVPFLATDIAKVANWDLTYSLYICVATGGLIVGIWQAFLLRARFRNAIWWAAASAIGWLLASGTAAISDALQRSKSLRGIGGALAYLGIITSGGLILGAVTGLMRIKLQQHESPV